MQGIRILIVDDEPEAGEILSLRLSRRGVLPSCARSGEEALAKLAASPVDIVLLDMKMPGMNGLEVLERIRRDHAGVYVIILSGHADMEAAAKGLELGAFSYMLKPVNFELLCNAIEDAQRQMSLKNKDA